LLTNIPSLLRLRRKINLNKISDAQTLDPDALLNSYKKFHNISKSKNVSQVSEKKFCPMKKLFQVICIIVSDFWGSQPKVIAQHRSSSTEESLREARVQHYKRYIAAIMQCNL
jgi:glycerate-2-kinase